MCLLLIILCNDFPLSQKRGCGWCLWDIQPCQYDIHCTSSCMSILVAFTWVFLVLWGRELHFFVASSSLLVQVDNLLKTSLADIASHWLLSGFNIRKHVPKKWHDRLEEPVASVTFHWLFPRSSMGTHASKKWHEQLEELLASVIFH